MSCPQGSCSSNRASYRPEPAVPGQSAAEFARLQEQLVQHEAELRVLDREEARLNAALDSLELRRLEVRKGKDATHVEIFRLAQAPSQYMADVLRRV